jgi:hypothetical protein
MLITCIVAPLALAGILGFAFGGGATAGDVRIGVSGASPQLVAAAARAAELPPQVSVHLVPRSATLTREVQQGAYDGGVIVDRRSPSLSDLLIPIISPGSTHTPGFRVVDRATSIIGQEWAESVAAALASRLYAGRIQPGSADHLAALSVATDEVGNASKGVLNYFAPSIAVIFLFIGGGLGMR